MKGILCKQSTVGVTEQQPPPCPAQPRLHVEGYSVIESRIIKATQILQARSGQPNLATTTREFSTYTALRARWNGRPSKIETVPTRFQYHNLKRKVLVPNRGFRCPPPCVYLSCFAWLPGTILGVFTGPRSPQSAVHTHAHARFNRDN